MKPRSRPESSQLDLFQAQFDQLLNLDHPRLLDDAASSAAACHLPDEVAAASG
jgi:hypothetical protein